MKMLTIKIGCRHVASLLLSISILGGLAAYGDDPRAPSMIIDQCESTRGLLRRVSFNSVAVGARGEERRRAFIALDFVNGWERQNTQLPDGEMNQISVNSKESRSLLRYDFDKKPKIQPAYQGETRAAIGLPHQLLRGPALLPRADYLLASFRSLGNDREWDLQSARSQFSIAKDSEDGLVVLEVMHPRSSSDPSFRDAWIEIGFDPSHGMLVKKFTTVIQDDRGVLMREGGKVRIEDEVLAFKSFGNGVYVPELIERRITDLGKGTPATLSSRKTLNDIRINDDVPDDLFAIEFPENVMVVDQNLDNASEAGKFKLYIAGKAGSLIPLRDVNELAERQSSYKSEGSTNYIWLWGLIVGACFALGVGFYRYWRLTNVL